jgi:hypothetical protein
LYAAIGLVELEDLLRLHFQLISSLAQFVEQPGVLDGDDSLGGKIADKLDLLLMVPISSSSLSIGTRRRVRCPPSNVRFTSERRHSIARIRTSRLARIDTGCVSQHTACEQVEARLATHGPCHKELPPSTSKGHSTPPIDKS